MGLPKRRNSPMTPLQWFPSAHWGIIVMCELLSGVYLTWFLTEYVICNKILICYTEKLMHGKIIKITSVFCICLNGIK